MAESRLRLQTIVRLRWFAVAGQVATIAVVYGMLRFAMPIGPCLALIALSAWLNVFLRIRFPTRHRLSVPVATSLLAYDIVQLAALLSLTGGIENPFVFMLVAPVTVSAATLPPRMTVALGLVAAAAAALISVTHWPLPWYPGEAFRTPPLYRAGMLAAVASGMAFLALYAFRLSKEARQMSAALAATEHVLAREQKLHALDGLAAAAAHELGTPLATITLVTKELEREVAKDSPIAEDIALLRSQALRCRDILQRLTRQPGAEDPHHASLSVSQLVQEAAAPHSAPGKRITIDAAGDPAGLAEPIGERRPGVIYGLGNILENAVDFARAEVKVTARWSELEVTLTIADDGPGFAADVLDSLGEPYVTTRGRGRAAAEGAQGSGLGLGFFIAKTLLERSGATLSLANRAAPASGAVVQIVWPRPAFDRTAATGQRADAAAA